MPATHADRLRLAEQSGAAAVRLAREGLTPRRIMTPAAFRNALTVLQAIGGSTNGLIHFTAIAGRLGIDLDLEAFDRLGREVPVLVDLKPSGAHYMEHFCWAGGVPRLLAELAPLLDTVGADRRRRHARRVDRRRRSSVPGQEVIRAAWRTRSTVGGGLAVLRGNLAPGGALLKRVGRHAGAAAATRAARWCSTASPTSRRGSTTSALDVRAEDVLVLRNAGPKGAPGMPEAGYLPIPRKLARAGVKDMVRISDARMSGTAFGTIVLHATPEAAVGGPLALVQTGDRIRLDAEARRLDLLVGDAELAAPPRGLGAAAPAAGRRARLPAAVPRPGAPGRSGVRLRLLPPRRGGAGQVRIAAWSCSAAACRARPTMSRKNELPRVVRRTSTRRRSSRSSSRATRSNCTSRSMMRVTPGRETCSISARLLTVCVVSSM